MQKSFKSYNLLGVKVLKLTKSRFCLYFINISRLSDGSSHRNLCSIALKLPMIVCWCVRNRSLLSNLSLRFIYTNLKMFGLTYLFSYVLGVPALREE